MTVIYIQVIWLSKRWLWLLNQSLTISINHRHHLMLITIFTYSSDYILPKSEHRFLLIWRFICLLLVVISVFLSLCLSFSLSLRPCTRVYLVSCLSSSTRFKTHQTVSAQLAGDLRTRTGGFVLHRGQLWHFEPRQNRERGRYAMNLRPSKEFLTFDPNDFDVPVSANFIAITVGSKWRLIYREF